MVAGPNSRTIKIVTYVCPACGNTKPEPPIGDVTAIGGAVICSCGGFMQRRVEKIKAKRKFKKHEPRD